VQVSLAIVPSDGAQPVEQRAQRPAAGASPARTDGAAPTDRVTVSPEARQASATARKLTGDQQREVVRLQQLDTHVRQHEAAHQAAGGSLTGAASFSYQTGPDGRSYAVGGEVSVRLQAGRTPDETIANARQARRAALAPTDPSPQDLAVAAQASELEQTATTRKAQQATRAYGKGAAAKAGKDGAAGEAKETAGRAGDGAPADGAEPAVERSLAA
jgi:hypothetical protein